MDEYTSLTLQLFFETGTLRSFRNIVSTVTAGGQVLLYPPISAPVPTRSRAGDAWSMSFGTSGVRLPIPRARHNE